MIDRKPWRSPNKAKAKNQSNKYNDCKTFGCKNKARVKGLCINCYQRIWIREHNEKHITKSN